MIISPTGLPGYPSDLSALRVTVARGCYSSFRLDSSEKWQIITVSKCDETISHSEKAHFFLSSSSYRSFSVVVYSMCVCLSTSEARSAEEVERQTHTIEKKHNRGGMLVLLLSLL